MFMELRVRLAEARNLPEIHAHKVPEFSVALPNVHCRLGLRGRETEFRTSIRPNSTTPVWNTEYTFKIHAYCHDVLQFVLVSEHFGQDIRMSNLCLKVCDLPPGQVVDQWYPLTQLSQIEPIEGDYLSRNGIPAKNTGQTYEISGPPGEIHVAVQLALKGSVPWHPSPFPIFQMVFTLIEAKGHTPKKSWDKTDPYCTIKITPTRAV
jgi:hypothetical protein